MRNETAQCWVKRDRYGRIVEGKEVMRKTYVARARPERFEQVLIDIDIKDADGNVIGKSYADKGQFMLVDKSDILPLWDVPRTTSWADDVLFYLYNGLPLSPEDDNHPWNIGYSEWIDGEEIEDSRSAMAYFLSEIY